MLDNAGPNHIHIDIDKALNQMFAGFNRRSVISIFPESAFPFLSHQTRHEVVWGGTLRI
jgi:hypothetical protein